MFYCMYRSGCADWWYPHSEYPDSEDDIVRRMKLRRSPRRKFRGEVVREKGRFIGLRGVGGEGLLSPRCGSGGVGADGEEALWGVRAEVVGKGEEAGRRSLSGKVEVEGE